MSSTVLNDSEMLIHEPLKGFFLKLVPVLVFYLCVLSLKIT